MQHIEKCAITVTQLEYVNTDEIFLAGLASQIHRLKFPRGSPPPPPQLSSNTDNLRKYY
jgi:hypothetical protein